jgi:hypothetical protein
MKKILSKIVKPITYASIAAVLACNPLHPTEWFSHDKKSIKSESVNDESAPTGIPWYNPLAWSGGYSKGELFGHEHKDMFVKYKMTNGIPGDMQELDNPMVYIDDFDGDKKKDILIINGRDIYFLKNDITSQKLKIEPEKDTTSEEDTLESRTNSSARDLMREYSKLK